MIAMNFVQCTNAQLGGTVDPVGTVTASASVSQRIAAASPLLDGTKERQCAIWMTKPSCCWWPWSQWHSFGFYGRSAAQSCGGLSWRLCSDRCTDVSCTQP